jgi:hypothetical protein
LSKEIVDAKRNFETVLSEVELIGGVKFIDFDGLRDVGVVFWDEFLKPLDHKCERHKPKNKGEESARSGGYVLFAVKVEFNGSSEYVCLVQCILQILSCASW